ncbi:hypothetical protein ABTF31_19885 [Acinetobacter baumannii]
MTLPLAINGKVPSKLVEVIWELVVVVVVVIMVIKKKKKKRKKS